MKKQPALTAWGLGVVLIVSGVNLARLTPAFAAGGDQLWISRYSGPGSAFDQAVAVAVNSDGSRVFVTGNSTGSRTLYDYATVAYAADTGARLWQRRFNGAGDNYDVATGLAVSPDGTRVFVTGDSPDATGNEDYQTFAYDSSTGAVVWSSRYDSPFSGYDEASGLSVSPDGARVFVTGISEGPGTYSDWSTVALDAATGAFLWVMRERSHGWDYTYAVVASPDGSRVYVTGELDGDLTTFAYEADTGAHVWRARYNPAGRGGEGRSFAVSPDGERVFVTGYLYGSGSGHHEDYATVAYAAATGAQLWSRLYNPGDLPDYGRSVAISPDGSRVFVTGSSEGTGSSSDYATLAYDADTGAGLWISRYTGLGGKRVDEGAALAVSPDGSRVFVTGWSSEGYLNPDYATLAYDAATGAPLWLARYNGPAGREDEANALALAPDGTRVFVTGSSVSSLGGDDYFTLAYQA